MVPPLVEPVELVPVATGVLLLEELLELLLVFGHRLAPVTGTAGVPLEAIGVPVPIADVPDEVIGVLVPLMVLVAPVTGTTPAVPVPTACVPDPSAEVPSAWVPETVPVPIAVPLLAAGVSVAMPNELVFWLVGIWLLFLLEAQAERISAAATTIVNRICFFIIL